MAVLVKPSRGMFGGCAGVSFPTLIAFLLSPALKRGFYLKSKAPGLMVFPNSRPSKLADKVHFTQGTVLPVVF